MGNAREGNKPFLLLGQHVVVERFAGSGQVLHGPPIAGDVRRGLFFQEEAEGVGLGGSAGSSGLPPIGFQSGLPTAVPLPQPGPYFGKFGFGSLYCQLLPVHPNSQPFQPIPIGDKSIKVVISRPLAQEVGEGVHTGNNKSVCPAVMSFFPANALILHAGGQFQLPQPDAQRLPAQRGPPPLRQLLAPTGCLHHKNEARWRGG